MKKYDVIGIGNAVVDVFNQADDSFIEMMGIEKGIMQLVERERGEVLYAAMKERVQAPGGSVANTIAGLGNLGVSVMQFLVPVVTVIRPSSGGLRIRATLASTCLRVLRRYAQNGHAVTQAS